jgi:hypothetical protein
LGSTYVKYATEYSGKITLIHKAMSPLPFWKVYDRVQEGIPKTLNFVEGFHNKLNKNFGIRRPSLWRFLVSLMRYKDAAKMRSPKSKLLVDFPKCSVEIIEN